MAKGRKAEDISNLKELTLDDIAKADDIVIQPVPVPEWGGVVYVRTMSGLEKEKYIESVRKTVGTGKNATEKVVLEESSAKLVVACMCDKTGRLVANAGHVKMLAKKSSKALQRVIDAGAALNGLDEEADAASKNESASEEATDDSTTV